MTQPVAHVAGDPAMWRKKWSESRKPAAKADGTSDANEANLTVTHDVADPVKFAKHVAKMEAAGKRAEMGAQNKPI